MAVRKLRLVSTRKQKFPVPVPPLKRKPVEPSKGLSEQTKSRLMVLALKEPSE